MRGAIVDTARSPEPDPRPRAAPPPPAGGAVCSLRIVPCERFKAAAGRMGRPRRLHRS